jgi:hypothetical protein
MGKDHKKIHFTNHAIERFRERFYLLCKDKKKGEVISEMYDLVNNNKPDRSFLNNTKYMIKLYERYGYDLDFEFLRHENMIFVARKDRARKIVLTCYPPDDRVFHNRVKFKKKDKKKEDKNISYRKLSRQGII